MFCEENVNKFSRGDGLQVFLLFYLKKMPEMFAGSKIVVPLQP